MTNRIKRRGVTNPFGRVKNRRQLSIGAGMQGAFDAVTRYFFRPGFKYQLGVTRIALFCAVLLTLFQQLILFSSAGWPSDYIASFPVFTHFGIMRFWTDPPLALLDICIVVGPIAAVLAIVGLATRPAMIVSTIATLMLVTASEGNDVYWSHRYPVIFFCALPFMFGRADAVLSVDALIWRRHKWWPFGKPAAEVEYSWPVIAGLIGAAAMFYGAFWAKLLHSRGLYYWVDSDNLRFSLAVTWLAYDRETVPRIIEWLWSTEWAWKTAAFFHIVMQLAPAATIFSLRRPVARAVEGAFYVASIVGLGMIMGLWHLPWLFLTAFFIDWDALITRKRPIASAKTIEQARAAAVLVPLALFLGVMHAIILFQLKKVLLYPFTPLSFYAGVRAEKPYSEHKHFPGQRCEFTMTVPSCKLVGLPDAKQSRASILGKSLSRSDWTCSSGEIRFRYANLWMGSSCERAETPEAQRAVLKRMRDALHRLPLRGMDRLPWRFTAPVPPISPDAVSMYFQRIQYPAYPNPIDPVVVQDGMKARLTRDDIFQSVTGQVDGRVFSVRAIGFGPHPDMAVMYRQNVQEKPGLQPERPLPGHWNGSRFTIDMAAAARPAYLTVVIHQNGRDTVFNDPSWTF